MNFRKNVNKSKLKFPLTENYHFSLNETLKQGARNILVLFYKYNSKRLKYLNITLILFTSQALSQLKFSLSFHPREHNIK